MEFREPLKGPRVGAGWRYLDHLGMADLRDALAPLPGYEVSPV